MLHAAMVMNEPEWDDDVENLGVLIWCEQHRIRFQLVIRATIAVHMLALCPVLLRNSMRESLAGQETSR